MADVFKFFDNAGPLPHHIHHRDKHANRVGAAYGMIMLQGHGTFGVHKIETPSLIRYGQLTNDEYFVSAKAAKEGVVIENTSNSDPIVMLKHFAENPDLKI